MITHLKALAMENVLGHDNDVPLYDNCVNVDNSILIASTASSTTAIADLKLGGTFLASKGEHRVMLGQLSTTTTVVSEGELHALLFGNPLASDCCRSTSITLIDDVVATTSITHYGLFGDISSKKSIKSPIATITNNHCESFGDPSLTSDCGSVLFRCPSSTTIHHRESFGLLSLSSTSEYGTTWIDDIISVNSVKPPNATTTIKYRDLSSHPSSTRRPSLTSEGGTTYFDNITAEKLPIAMNSINHRDLLDCLSSSVSLIGCPSSNSDSTICIGGTNVAPEGDILSKFVLHDDNGVLLYNNSCVKVDDGILIAPAVQPTTTADSEGSTFRSTFSTEGRTISEGEHHQVSFGSITTTSTGSTTFRWCSSTFGIDGTMMFGFLPSTSTSSCVISLIDDALPKKSTRPTTPTTTMNINSPTSTTGTTTININDNATRLPSFISVEKSIEAPIATTVINDYYFSTGKVGTFMVAFNNNTPAIPLLCPSSWKPDDNGIRRYSIDNGLSENQPKTKLSDQHGTTTDDSVALQGAPTLAMVQDSAVCLSNADNRDIIQSGNTLGSIQDSNVFSQMTILTCLFTRPTATSFSLPVKSTLLSLVTISTMTIIPFRPTLLTTIQMESL